MLKTFIKILNTPIPLPFSKKNRYKILVNLYCRNDFPEIKMKYNDQILNKVQNITTIRQLCHLYFSLCDDESLVVLQNFTNKQPEYTLISQKTVPSEVIKRLYTYLPDGMIVIVRHRETDIS